VAVTRPRDPAPRPGPTTVIVREDLRQSPYEPAGLVRTSDTVKIQRYGHFFSLIKEN
jgi:hypothetical protein